MLWLEQVASDRAVGPAAFKLAFLLTAHFLNREIFERSGSMEAWPSQERLASEMGMTTRAIRSLVGELRRDHLVVREARGRGHTNTYALVLKEPPIMATSDQRQIAPQRAPVFDEQHDHRISALAADFDEWWSQYPKKVAKEAARRAYARVRRKGMTAGDLLTGAMRYSAERSGQDQQFTKYPATWLNGGCWEDEQQSPRAPTSEAAVHRPQQQQRSHLEIALGGYRE
jgi:biotin operon repressor